MSDVATETTEDNAAVPVMDRATELLADVIGKAFDAYNWAGGDHTNHPLDDVLRVAVNGAAPAVAELLTELDTACAPRAPMDYALVAAVLQHDYTVAPGGSRPYGDAVEDRNTALRNAEQMHRLIGSERDAAEELRLRVEQADLAVKYYGAQAKRRKAERDETRVVVEQVRSELRRERELVQRLRSQLVPVSQLELDMAEMERELRAAVQHPKGFVSISDRLGWGALLHEVSVAFVQRDHLRDAAAPDPCVEHDVLVERLRVAVGGSDGQGLEDWISAVEEKETAKDEEIRRLRAYIGDVDRERSADHLRGVTTRDGTVRVIRADEKPVPGDRLPYGTVQPDGSVEPYPEEMQHLCEAIAKAGGEDWDEIVQFRRDLIWRDARAVFRWLADAGFLSPSAPMREYGVPSSDVEEPSSE